MYRIYYLSWHVKNHLILLKSLRTLGALWYRITSAFYSNNLINYRNFLLSCYCSLSAIENLGQYALGYTILTKFWNICSWLDRTKIIMSTKSEKALWWSEILKILFCRESETETVSFVTKFHFLLVIFYLELSTNVPFLFFL